MGLIMFYKTNEDTELLTVNEFINEWQDKEEYLFVDIRETDEIATNGGVKGAFNISMYDIPEQIEMAPSYIVCIFLCDNGGRSAQIAKYFKNNEFENMFAIEGGIEALVATCPELKV